MASTFATDSLPLPLYLQVREHLRERILDGTYPPHAQLPAESELGSMFGVSRITIRQALADLQKEGVIIKIPGKGSFVARPKAFQPLTQLEGFAEAMSRLGHSIRNHVISHKTISASIEVARQLQLRPESPVCEIKRVRYLDHEPVSLEVTYLLEDIGDRLRHEDLQGRDIFLILENDYRIALGHADLQIEAVLADEHLAAALQVFSGTPLLKLNRLTYTEAGAPLDFEYLHFRTDIFQYRLQVSRQRTGVGDVQDSDQSSSSFTDDKHDANTYPDR